MRERDEAFVYWAVEIDDGDAAVVGCCYMRIFWRDQKVRWLPEEVTWHFSHFQLLQMNKKFFGREWHGGNAEKTECLVAVCILCSC